MNMLPIALLAYSPMPCALAPRVRAPVMLLEGATVSDTIGASVNLVAEVNFLDDPFVRNFAAVSLFAGFKIFSEVSGENRVDAKGWAIWLSIAYGLTACFTYRMLNPIVVPPANAAEIPSHVAQFAELLFEVPPQPAAGGDGTTVLLGLEVAGANGGSAWQLASPFGANGMMPLVLARDLFLIYIYAHVPAFAYLGLFYGKNGSLKNAWPPSIEKIQ